MQRLIAEIRTIVAAGRIDEEAIDRLSARVLAAVPRLQGAGLCAQPPAPGRYLCYRDPDHGFVVMVLVWARGDGTRIHDHGTWGVEAVLKNRLKVTNYDLSETNPQPLDSHAIGEGAVIHNLPPARDVHKVENDSEGCALSLHVYGREMSANRSFFPGEGFKPCPLECRELKLEAPLPCGRAATHAGTL